MANQYPSGMAISGPAETGSAGKERTRSSWLRSIMAGAGMLAASSFGAVGVFDWYFFSVVDELSTVLQPIAGVFRQASDDALKNAGRAQERHEHTTTKEPREYLTVPFEEPSDQAGIKSLSIGVGR